MTLYNVLSWLFGSGVLVTVGGYFLRRIKSNDQKTEAVQKGVQALLRDRLIQTYDKWIDRGFAPIYVRENFENMWIQYHNLGQNGVMDGLHETFMHLPTEKKGEENHD